MYKKIFKYSLKTLSVTARIIIFLVFLAALLAGSAMTVAWFTAVKYFNAAYAGRVLTVGLSRTFNRPVVMESIKLISLNAVEIKNLKIIDNTPGFYNEFISVGSVVLRYNLLPIKDGRVEINEIVLKDPSLSIVKNADGVLNISGLNLRGRKSARGTRFEISGPNGRPLEMIIEDWTISNGTLSYRDIPGRASHSLNGIFVHFDNLKFDDFTNYTLSFVLHNNIQDKVIETEFISKGAVNLANFSLENMALQKSALELRGFRKPLSLSLEVQNFASPRVSITAPLPAFGNEDIALFVKKIPKFSMPALNLTAKINFTEGFQKINVPSLNLKNADINVEVSGTMDIGPSPFVADAKFKTKEFEVSKADYFGILKPYALKGKMSADGSFIYKAGKASFPKVTAELNGVSAFISNFTIQNVKGKYEAENNFDVMNATVADGIFKVGRQTITGIKGRASYEHAKQNFYALLNDCGFNGQKLRMSVAISRVRNAARRVVKTMVYAQRFDPLEVFDTVEDFVEALAPAGASAPRQAKDTSSLSWLRNFRAALPGFMPNVRGSVFAESFESPIITGKNFTAEVDLKGLLPGMDKLTGKIEAKLETGKILKMQEAADRWTALGIAFQPFVIMNNMERAGSFKMGQILKDTPYDRMLASADFTNGQMKINNFYVDGRVIAATVGGKVDWVGENMDLDIFTMFKNTSKRGALSENLTDESGEPALAFKASGSMNKPAIAMKSPKKTGAQIKAARDLGLKTDFTAIEKFVKEK